MVHFNLPTRISFRSLADKRLEFESSVERGCVVGSMLIATAIVGMPRLETLKYGIV